MSAEPVSWKLSGAAKVPEKNSIVDNYLDHFNPAFVPCIKEKCPGGREQKGCGG
jgi:hypothetical protein